MFSPYSTLSITDQQEEAALFNVAFSFRINVGNHQVEQQIYKMLCY